MAIRSFFFTLAKMNIELRARPGALALIPVIFALLLNTSCASKTKTAQPRGGTPSSSTPEIIPKSERDGGHSGRDDVRFGLILGPGSVKTFAHLGVLEALEKARMPIVGVTGLEWGALAAGLYGVQGKAFDAQWKMFKLEERDLPAKKLLSKYIEPGAIASLDPFLSKTFGHMSLEQTKKSFACPTRSTRTGQVQILARGLMNEAIKSCMAFPPFFTPNGEWAADPFGVFEAAEYLRSIGANRIVLVDVLSGSSLMSEQVAREHVALYLLWLEQQKLLESLYSRVDEVITVKTGNIGLDNFEQRRRLHEQGLTVGKSAAQRLVHKYGF